MSVTLKALWGLAAVLAVAVAVGFVNVRRDAEQKVTVMVAKQLIPAGVYVNPNTITLTPMPRAEVEPGAITDVRYIAFHSVAHEIFPGQVLRRSDFSR